MRKNQHARINGGLHLFSTCETSHDHQTIRNYLPTALLVILKQVEVRNADSDHLSDTIDHLHYRMGSLYRVTLRCFDFGICQEKVLTFIVEEVMECLHSIESDSTYRTDTVFSGNPGRPIYNLSREKLEFLVENRVSVAEVVDLLDVGKSHDHHFCAGMAQW